MSPMAKMCGTLVRIWISTLRKPPSVALADLIDGDNGKSSAIRQSRKREDA
jgi:hypothetical protein